MKKTLILPAIALLPVSPAFAQQFEDLSALDANVASALGVGSAKPIDRRLKLARCPEPVTLDTSAPSVVVLRCHPVGWRIRVPVAQSVGTSNVGEILVKRGETVEIVYRGDDFEVVSSGTANEDGFRGKRIRVKSSTGSGSVMGTVAGQGQIYIQD